MFDISHGSLVIRQKTEADNYSSPISFLATLFLVRSLEWLQPPMKMEVWRTVKEKDHEMILIIKDIQGS